MKKMIIGLVIGLMLGMSTNAFAAIGDKVQAIFAEFNYVVDGNEKVLDSPVLVYEGTSYVRTTQIANLLGFDVTYKADSRTIEFNKPKTSPVPTLEPSTITTLNPTPEPEPEKVLTSLPGTVTPTQETTPIPTLSPTPIPTPSPKPDNTAQCQAIRDNYGSQIAMVGYDGGAEGPKRLKVLGLQNQMASSLSAAGC